MNSYELSRVWFNYCFDNPERIKPLHTAIYFFAIEHCNRLGWKEKFGFPSQMVMEAIGVKNWRTYSKGLLDLVDFGFIKMIEISKNQYSSNIIAIVKNTKAPTKALDKALSKHSTKQGQSTVSIDKQLNKEQLNKIQYTDEIKNFTNSILKYFPIQPKKIESWYDVTEKLMRIDNYNLDSITLIVETFTKDDFWAKNFQSYTKLRNKNKDGIIYADYFKNTLIAENNGTTKRTNKKGGATVDEIGAILKKHFD